MNITEFIQLNYFNLENKDESKMKNTPTPESTSTPVLTSTNIQSSIDENGLLKMNGSERYLKLGIINLLDPIHQALPSSNKYLSVLDTETGTVICMSLANVYDECNQTGEFALKTNDDKVYRISSHTKEIILNNQKKK